MRFNPFETRSEPHIRKSLDYLEEASLAWVEHQAAAEHHAALAKMYAERIARIELELSKFHQTRTEMHRPQPEEARGDSPADRVKIESVVAYPSRLNR